jgi:hypothetical protein
MLSIEMECGVCAAAFSISMTEDDFQDTAWLMAQRYMNAHALSCNYATPMPGVSTDEDDAEQSD